MPTRLCPDELSILRTLIGSKPDQIVWDLNAIYLVRDSSTIKIEAHAVELESSTLNAHDEVFTISVKVENALRSFDQHGEPGLAYKVITQNEVINDISLITTAVRFPDNKPVPVSKTDEGVNLIDCGVLVHVDRGVLAAVQLHPCFGFFNFQNPPELLSLEEVSEKLGLLYLYSSVA